VERCSNAIVATWLQAAAKHGLERRESLGLQLCGFQPNRDRALHPHHGIRRVCHTLGHSSGVVLSWPQFRISAPVGDERTRSPPAADVPARIAAPSWPRRAVCTTGRSVAGVAPLRAAHGPPATSWSCASSPKPARASRACCASRRSRRAPRIVARTVATVNPTAGKLCLEVWRTCGSVTRSRYEARPLPCRSSAFEARAERDRYGQPTAIAVHNAGPARRSRGLELYGGPNPMPAVSRSAKIGPGASSATVHGGGWRATRTLRERRPDRSRHRLGEDGETCEHHARAARPREPRLARRRVAHQRRAEGCAPAHGRRDAAARNPGDAPLEGVSALLMPVPGPTFSPTRSRLTRVASSKPTCARPRTACCCAWTAGPGARSVLRFSYRAAFADPRTLDALHVHVLARAANVPDLELEAGRSSRPSADVRADRDLSRRDRRRRAGLRDRGRDHERGERAHSIGCAFGSTSPTPSRAIP